MRIRIRMGSLLLTGFALSWAMMLPACTTNEITFVADNATYSATTVDDLRIAVDAPDYGEDGASKAEGLRHDRLVELRALGQEAAGAADLLTQEFPDEDSAVPFYVEAARFDGTDAWIVLEVVASDTGRLDRIRLWVFDRNTRDVIRASSFN